MTLAAILAVGVLLSLKIINYTAPQTLRLSNLGVAAQRASDSWSSWVRNTSWLHECPPARRMREIQGGFVCDYYAEPADTVERIFASYRAVGGSGSQIYPSLFDEDTSGADDQLGLEIHLPKYGPVHVNPEVDWSAVEGPNAAWRLEYYGLRHTVALTRAFERTGRTQYLDRVVSVLRSFEKDAANNHKWESSTAVAIRGIVYCWQWWSLREYHALERSDSSALLKEISRTANYLEDPEHFDPRNHQAIDQAAGLLQIALSFPDLAGAAGWQATARVRLNSAVAKLVDSDGVLVDSPLSAHFATMGKLWEIRRFATLNGVQIGSDLDAKIAAMVKYATYSLRPDQSLPELDSQLPQVVNLHGAYRGIADEFPEFAYVLTKGDQGVAPAQTSIAFDEGGTSVFRSAWGRGAGFGNQTYLTLNTGSSEGDRAHRDLLGVTLYDDSVQQIPEAGQVTSNSGPVLRYATGTSAHNAVVVDESSQLPGRSETTPQTNPDGVTVQSAAADVYPGVDYRRSVAMLDPGIFLVIDRLSGASSHTYDQTWHFMPGSAVSTSESEATAVGPNPRQHVTIRQLGSAAGFPRRDPSRPNRPIALCAGAGADQAPVACPQISFRQTGKQALFVTLLTSRRPDVAAASFDAASATVRVTTPGGTKEIRITDTPSVAKRVTSTPPAAWAGRPVRMRMDANSLTLRGGSTLQALGDGVVGLRLRSARDEASADVRLDQPDLSSRTLQVRARMNRAVGGSNVRIELQDRSGARVRLNLRSLYDRRADMEWTTLSIPTGATSGLQGRWEGARGFDWSKVLTMRLVLGARPGPLGVPVADFAWIGTVPKQTSGVVAIVFDDGYASILSAAKVMRAAGIPGNVAVIGHSLAAQTRSALRADQLRSLQDDWGWNIVNHTERHLDLVDAYSRPGAAAAFETDLLTGQQRLAQAGLNSAPNWIVYPHGSSSWHLDPIIGKYYTFGRTTQPGMDAFPFASPLRVHNFEVHYPDDSMDAPKSVKTTPEQVARALADAKSSRATLMLTFHSIHAVPTDRPGYPIAEFTRIVQAIKASGLPVKTLSELDSTFGVPYQNQVTVRPGTLGQLDLKVTTLAATPTDASLWDWLVRIFG